MKCYRVISKLRCNAKPRKLVIPIQRLLGQNKPTECIGGDKTFLYVIITEKNV